MGGIEDARPPAVAAVRAKTDGRRALLEASRPRQRRLDHRRRRLTAPPRNLGGLFHVFVDGAMVRQPQSVWSIRRGRETPRNSHDRPPPSLTIRTARRAALGLPPFRPLTSAAGRGNMGAGDGATKEGRGC